MAVPIVVGVNLQDEELLDKTAESYAGAVYRGEMTISEMEENLTALIYGMLTFQCTTAPNS